MKRVIKWLAIILLTPILLFFILTLLLYLPPVQNWAVRQVASYASHETGMDITVDNVRLAFPLDLEVNGFKMIKPTVPPDTVADVERLVVDVSLLPLLDGQVEVNALELNEAKINTLDMIPAARIKGKVGRLYLQSHGIDLNAETVRVNTAQLERSQIDIALSDSVPEDTTESTADWKIDIDGLDISQTALALHMPGDTMSVALSMDKAKARQAYLGLKAGEYRVGSLDWNGGRFNYDQNYVKPAAKGFDGSHIAMTDVNIGADSIVVRTPDISANIRQASFKEKSGLDVRSFDGRFSMDDKRLALHDAHIETSDSRVAANFQMDLNTFADKNPGKLFADVDAQIGKHDMLVFAPDLPREMMVKWPNRQLSVKGHAEGNMQYITFKNLHAQLPTAFDVTTTGWLANPTNPDKMRGEVRLKGRTDNLDFVTAMLPAETRKQISIPRGIGIDGNVKINGSQYNADLTATEGGGSVKVKGIVDTRTMAYNIKANANNLQLNHFLPGQGLGPFSGDIVAEGRGTDFLNPKTGAKVTLNVRQFQYGGYNLAGLGGDIRLNNGMLHANINSTNPMVGGKFSVDGRLAANNVDLYIKGHINNADLKALGVTDQRYVITTDADMRVKTNMKNSYAVDGTFGNFSLQEDKGKGLMVPVAEGNFDVDFNSDLNEYYAAKGYIDNLRIYEGGEDSSYDVNNVSFDVLTKRNATHALVESEGLYLNADLDEGYKQLLRRADNITREVERQYKNRQLNQAAIKQQLPNGRIRLRSDSDNIMARLLRYGGYDVGVIDLDVTTSSADGLQGGGYVTSLTLLNDSITLDSVGIALNSNDDQLGYDLMVRNNKNNAYPFTGRMQGQLQEEGLSTAVTLWDGQDKVGLDVSLLAGITQDGYRLNITSPRSVLGYKEFSVNKDNYILIGKGRRLSAQMKLQADDGAGVHIYTDDSDEDVLQNITLSMHRFELEKLFSVIPYTPQVSGVLDGDYHVIQTKNELMVSTDMTIKNFVYEHSPMGNVGTQLVYVPQEDGSHYVDGIVLQDGREVGTLTGTYKSEGEGSLDANFHLNRFPLHYANGFVPDQIIGLRGTGEGNLTVKGPLNRLDINGEILLDSSYIYSDPYGVSMRFGNDPVRIQHSKVLFENFEVYANNDSPLNIQGNLDFSNMDKMMLDIRMRARNFLLVDAKENPRSELYGKAYVNFFGSMRGPLSALRMRGKLDLLGNSDMTYVLKESTLTTDNEMDDLVKFTNFSDSTAVVTVQRPDISGFNMDMSIGIDEQAHVMCALNADHSNYINLIGGGNLRMTYDPTNDLRLTGRYTLSEGEMKYSLPVIPLRTFNIQEGSYLEFTGEAVNPTLFITATERLRSSVSDGTSSGRIVDFNCGVRLTQTLAKPTIEFIIEAPEDMQVQNELNTKSVEERGKLAVTMLASGVYLGEGGGNANASMSGALASFMQSEINNITGSALRSMGLDISANMETSTDASGGLHTDYTFKFSKRLWNNRLRLIMGGRVSTGSTAGGDNGAFFDSFSMEYRLNKNETQYLKLFYEREAYDWLEGDLSEFGAGFMWRRKLDHFKDIFNFKTKKPQMMRPVQRRDTLVNFQNPNINHENVPDSLHKE